MTTDPIDKIEDQSHCHTELFKVQLSIPVHISQIPNLFKLVISQLAVSQDCCCLLVVEASCAVRQRGEDLPVTIYLPLLDLLA